MALNEGILSLFFCFFFLKKGGWGVFISKETLIEGFLTTAKKNQGNPHFNSLYKIQ